MNDGIIWVRCIEINDLPAIIYPAYQVWAKENCVHRENDLPAIIYNNGKKEWYDVGNLHRENDLPASMDDDQQMWYTNNMIHPATTNMCEFGVTVYSVFTCK